MWKWVSKWLRPGSPGMTVKTGAELQALRKEAAERFTAIAMQSVPEGWTVEYHKSLSGSCWPAQKRIQAPRGR
jgi:hypothetical protein